MHSKQIQQTIKAIEEAEFILIGASNGLEMAEGYNLFAPNDYFMKHYQDFYDQYGVQSILQGLIQRPFPDEETLWAFFARNLYESYYYQPTAVMKNLYQLIGEKPHFILTSNGTRRIKASGFKDDNLFEIEGSLGALQCSQGCHDEVYPLEDWIDEIYERAKDHTRIPSEMVPRCEKCDAYLMPNFEIAPSFIRSAHWHQQQQKVQELFQNLTEKSFLVLELGIGFRNQLIKAPLMNIVRHSPQSTYITINKGEIYIPNEIHEQSIGIDGDLAQILENLVKAQESLYGN